MLGVKQAFLLSLFSGHGVFADYLMGSNPPPIDLTSNNSLVAAAWLNVSSQFKSIASATNNSGTLEGIENITFSAGMFSLHDPAAINLQYHYTSPAIASAPNGTHEVDENSIYMIASVSKLITVYTGMLSLTTEQWNRPVTELNPQFQQLLEQHLPPNVIYNIPWDQITPWSLATQLSGIPTLGVLVPGFDLYNPSETKEYGAPAISVDALGECVIEYFQNPADAICDDPQAFSTLNMTPPNFLPWSTPIYSDLGYMILGELISNVTGRELSQVYRDAVFDPLGMDSSSDVFQSDNASVARSVITEWTAFTEVLDFTVPSGGIRSTLSDLQKLGIGIMNNTLLSANATRKWMKPTSDTPSFSYSIGAPWEIHRFVHPTSQRVTDLYTKLGDSGTYGSSVVLIPQYDAGFSFLNAGTQDSRSPLALNILDYITNTILPALEAQAQAEASRNYVGTYTNTDANGVNASMVVTFNSTVVPWRSHSGLQITKWTYNGTDVLAGSFFGGYQPRLQPSIPNQAAPGSPGQVAFQATTASTAITALTYMEAMQIPELQTIGTWTGFYNSYGDFVLTDHERWAGVSATMIVFDVDGEGRATAVTPAVDRVTLTRAQ